MWNAVVNYVSLGISKSGQGFDRKKQAIVMKILNRINIL